jgi:hypothetical protein
MQLRDEEIISDRREQKRGGEGIPGPSLVGFDQRAGDLCQKPADLGDLDRENPQGQETGGRSLPPDPPMDKASPSLSLPETLTPWTNFRYRFTCVNATSSNALARKNCAVC